MDPLNPLRNQIDVLDEQIMDLLNQRFDLALKIGAIKATINKDVLDESREQTILSKTTKYSHSPQIDVVYKTIMKASKSLQRK